MDLLTWFNDQMSVRLAQTLLHFVWQGAGIGAVAFLVNRSFKSASAHSKYVLHVMAMLAMAACLPLTFVLVNAPATNRTTVAAVRNTLRTSSAEPAMAIDLDRTLTNAVDGTVAELDSQPIEIETEVSELVPMAASTIPNAEGASRFVGPGAPDPSNDELFWLSWLAPYLSSIYVVCVIGMIVRLVHALCGGHQLRITSQRVSDPTILKGLTAQAKRMGMRVVPVIAWCERISVPIVVGVFRPMILLPACLATGLAPHQLASLIAHELAHLRRFDPVLNLVQRLVEAVTFFHPAIWYISHRIDVEREYATDDMVLATGWRDVHYADALVRMAELSSQLRLGDPHISVLAASGGGNSEFTRRVVRLLNGGNSTVQLTHTGLALFLLTISSLAFAPLVVQVAGQAVADVRHSEGFSEEQLGRRIDEFQLRDFRGKNHSLADLAANELVVVVFLGTECPLAKLYGTRLQNLANQYEDRRVAFIGINSNQQDTPTELGHYARRQNISFPLLKDAGNRVADQFQAVRTPEVFVLDNERIIRYCGRIDDQFGVGYAKPDADVHYLAAAIDDLLAGKEVREPRTNSVGCYISRVHRGPPSGNITYTEHIAAILQDRCVECHRDSGIAPFSLQSYDDAAAWSETISEVVKDHRMPPWHANPKYGHFSNDRRMPESEKLLLHQWVANGTPRGDSTLPPNREFADGWLMGTPDLVLTVPKPNTVPATGVVDYQYVEIDPKFTDGRWVRASEIRPGVRSVVHHIIVFINPPGGDPILEERGVGFETVGGYVPGAAPMQLQTGVARFVPAGSTFIFQIHYTPDGTVRRDQSQLGLYFADSNTIRRTMQTGVAAHLDFEIPPDAENYQVEATHRFSHDMELHTLVPHMHFRGKSFRFEAIYPNGSREILLDVPNYDFNWQHAYQLAKPKLMPEGTLLKCKAHFDNSENNLANPDPTVAVRWGEQSWEEMMIGYFDGIFLNQDISMPEPKITANGDGTYLVHFEFKPDRPATTVHLAGTFNEWNTNSHPLTDPDGDGIFTTDVTVNEGDHRYKFVIDGHYWSHDPASRILTGFLHESFFVAGRETARRQADAR